MPDTTDPYPPRVRAELNRRGAGGGHHYYAMHLGRVRDGQQVHHSTLRAFRRDGLVACARLTGLGRMVLADALARVEREEASRG